MALVIWKPYSINSCYKLPNECSKAPILLHNLPYKLSDHANLDLLVTWVYDNLLMIEVDAQYMRKSYNYMNCGVEHKVDVIVSVIIIAEVRVRILFKYEFFRYSSTVTYVV